MEDEKEYDSDSNEEKKSTKSGKKNIVEIVNTVKPEIILEHCCGIFRFQLVNEELRPPNWKMKAFGILIISIYTVVFFWYCLLPPSPEDIAWKFNLIQDIMDVFPSVVVLFQYAASMITANFFISSISIRMVTLLADVDTTLRVETLTDFNKKLGSRFNKYLIFLILTHVINGVMDMCSVQDVQWGIMVWPLYFIQKLEVFIFCACVIMVNGRLAIINNYLKEFVQNQDKNMAIFTVRHTEVKTEKTFNFIGHPSVRNTKIKDLATAYDNIGEICFMINDVFNFQIFLTLVSTFTYIVTTIWISLSFYRTANYHVSELINNMIWCFNTIFNVGTMSFTCERLLITRKETRILVNKIIMNYDLPKTMRVQAKAFMELVEAWPLRIHVYDMFSIDIKLMLKFISVATTYLIVIIQISHLISI